MLIWDISDPQCKICGQYLQKGHQMSRKCAREIDRWKECVQHCPIWQCLCFHLSYHWPYAWNSSFLCLSRMKSCYHAIRFVQRVFLLVLRSITDHLQAVVNRNKLSTYMGSPKSSWKICIIKRVKPGFQSCSTPQSIHSIINYISVNFLEYPCQFSVSISRSLSLFHRNSWNADGI